MSNTECFKPGDVLTADRGLYHHYGIYCGNNVVVHFAMDSQHDICAEKAFIQKTTLELFSRGDKVTVEEKNIPSLSRKETVSRALQAVGSGKGSYNLAFHNCEHFANWCKYGKNESRQVMQAFAAAAGIVAAGLLTAGILGNDSNA